MAFVWNSKSNACRYRVCNRDDLFASFKKSKICMGNYHSDDFYIDNDPFGCIYQYFPELPAERLIYADNHFCGFNRPGLFGHF